MLDRPARDAKRAQLPARDDPPLPTRQLGERLQRGCAANTRTIRVNAAHPLSVADDASHGTPQTSQVSATARAKLRRRGRVQSPPPAVLGDSGSVPQVHALMAGGSANAASVPDAIVAAATEKGASDL